MTRFIDPPESLDRDGASFLATKIAAYWLERGFDVHAWVEPLPSRDGRVFAVRSDLLAGWPRGTRPSEPGTLEVTVR